MLDGNTFLGPLTNNPTIGAGGWSTSLQFAADGTALKRTDSYGAYSRAPGGSVWVRELIPGVTIATADIDILYDPEGGGAYPSGSMGVYCQAIAWSNSAVRALGVFGCIFIKKPGATIYTKTPLPTRAGMHPNEATRIYNNPLDFDPANPSVFVFGSPQGGFIFTNYGDNYTAISTASLPAPNANQRMDFRFDRSSPVIGSGLAARTQRILCFINGHGLYETNNAGANWVKIANKPTNPVNAGHLKINPFNGHVWVSARGDIQDNAKASRWDGLTWFETSFNTKTIVISPHNVGDIYAIEEGGGIRVSRNHGDTWDADITGTTLTSVDIPWHEQVEPTKSVGEAEFSPIENAIYMSAGIGAWKIPNPPRNIVFNTSPSIVGISRGNESMVMGSAVIAPDGTRGYSMHDRGGMIIKRNKVGKSFPTAYGPRPTELDHVQTMDYDPTDTNFWMAARWFGQTHMGWTPDGGETWTMNNTLAVQTNGRGGGQIVTLSKDVAIAVQLSDFEFYDPVKNGLYICRNARDAAQIWMPIQIGSGLAIDAHRNYYVGRRVLVKDRYTDGNIRRVMFYNTSNVDNPTHANAITDRGVWEILINMTTGEVTVNRKFGQLINAVPSNSDAYYAKLTQVGPDDWAFCGGDNCLGGYKRSIDGGSNWNSITGTDDQGAGDRFAEVFGIGVGKAKPGSAFLTQFVVGYRKFNSTRRTNAEHNKYGLWYSTDNANFWKRAQNWPGNTYDHVQDIAGDPSEFGVVDVCFSGTGATKVDINDHSLLAG